MFDDDEDEEKRVQRKERRKEDLPFVTTFRYGDDIDRAMNLIADELRCTRGQAIRTAIRAFAKLPFARMLDILPPTPSTITIMAPPPPEPEPVSAPEPLSMKRKKVREAQEQGSNRGVYDDMYAEAMAMLDALDVGEVP